MTTSAMDSKHLREQLMASSPMERALGLHALEVEAEHGGTAASAATKFVARGIPFYATQDPYYRAWVDKAVELWERLHAATAKAPARASRAH